MENIQNRHTLQDDQAGQAKQVRQAGKRMKFIGRAEELRTVKKLAKGRFFLVVTGRRRIGKTTFLKTCFPSAAYIFVWPNKTMDWMVEKVCEEQKLPGLKRFGDVVAVLLDRGKTVIIDEVQNFLGVDKSVFGELQKIIDERKDVRIATAGSSYSLINKVFNSEASPLYGRRTAEIALSHLLPEDLYKALPFSLEEFITLWAVFEGVPYYYTLLDGSPAGENIRRLLLRRDALLREEGRAVLAIEFGQDAKTYNTVLMAIAEGKTKLQEIGGLFGNRMGETVKYVDILRRDFRLVRRITPLLADPKRSREGRYEIADHFLRFWFYFVDRWRDYIEQERFGEVEQFFLNQFNPFVGRQFERLVCQLFDRGVIPQPFVAEHVGRQWGAVPTKAKGENQYEIDMVAVNKRTKDILFAECKWQDGVDAEKVVAELREKALSVPWHSGERKEHFAVFAKSFQKRAAGALCGDLKDMERWIRKAGKR